MDNRYNEIRHEVGIVRAAMLETEASIRDQISVCVHCALILPNDSFGATAVGAKRTLVDIPMLA